MPYHRPIPDPNPRGRTSAVTAAWVQAEKYIQIALVLPSGAFIGWLLGAWLGGRFHQPWIVMVGLVVGIVAGLSAAIRMAIAFTAGPQSNGPQPDDAAKMPTGGEGPRKNP
ncbi:MAG TPA: AtpZ/AtpI family protein [Terracidiphilus sp.]|nr:AtpZ/AtpI family protein [Terracidiphilus sp.]